MSKKQKRLSGKEQILKDAVLLAGKRVQVVLDNKQVYFIHLLSLGQESVQGTNMRGRKMQFPYPTITEIILDY
jgi:hypothetical protein